MPNYRTSPSLQDYEPLTIGEKFKVASEDSFDRGTVALAAIFAGEAQLTNANRSFGQGGAGFGRYFGTAYGDFVIGNYMTEARVPHASSSGSAVFQTRHRKRMVQAGLRHETDLLDSS